MKFSWTTLHVSDLDRSLKFYSELLGIPVANRFSSGPSNIAFIGDANGAQVELICTPEGAPADPGRGVSVGFVTGQLDELISKLRGAGCEIRGPISPSPKITFYFVSDPDGYQVQLCRQSD